MQTLNVNNYDMSYLDIGKSSATNPPLVLVRGTLGDFRTWNAVSDHCRRSIAWSR